MNVKHGLYQLLLNLIVDDLVKYSEACRPHEAVALLTSKGRIHPLINQRRSSHEFMVSISLVQEAIEEIQASGDTPVAIFHSHPNGSARPSKTDKKMMSEASDTVFVILGSDCVAAYLWEDGDTKEIARARVE